MSRKICLLDADSILFIVTHNKKGDLVKTLEDCKKYTDEFLESLFRLTQSTHYILFLTTGKQSFRYKVDPKYKSNRVHREKPQFLDQVKDYLVTEYHAKYDFNYESDDLVCISKNYLKNKYPEDEVFISSPDKDILNLEGKHYDYRKNIWVETTEQEADLAFFTDLLTGQSGDGIQGIPFVGIKTAKKILEAKRADNPHYSELVFTEYIKYFGVHLGIQEFGKNYSLLKMIQEDPEYKVPEPNLIKYDKE